MVCVGVMVDVGMWSARDALSCVVLDASRLGYVACDWVIQRGALVEM